jgi:membrane protein EpsK
MNTDSTDHRGNSLPLNLIANCTNFAVSIIIGFWFTPFLIKNLGLSSYGLIPLALTMTSYLSLVTLLINSATGRYMIIALEKKDFDTANRIFNTVLISSFSAILVIGLITTFLLTPILHFLRVPQGNEHSLYILFICTIVGFSITTIENPFEISTYCLNRFDLRNLISLSGSIIRVVAVALLFYFLKPQIWHIGAGIVLSALFTFCLSFYISRLLLPKLRIAWHLWDYSQFRQISGTSIWIFISQIGTILLINIDLLVVNRLFGPTDSGAYASISQWSSLMRSLATTNSGVFAPTIISLFAQRDIKEMIGYTHRAVRLISVLILLPVSFLFGFSKPLLLLWIGSSVVPYAPLLMIMLVHLPLSLSYLPLHHISIATNNVRIPGIVQIFAGIINLGLAIYLSRIPSLGFYGIALAGAIVLFVRNVLFTPLYAAHIINKPLLTFMRQVFPIFIISIISSFLCLFIARTLMPSTWVHLILCGALFSLLYLVVMYAFFLEETERSFILTKLAHLRNIYRRTNVS